MTKFKLTSLFLTLLLFSASKAQNINNSLLWEISGKELKQPSYIFGILKFIPADQYYFPQIVADKFNESQILAIETTLDHHARHELNKAAHLEHHESLADYLNEQELNQLKEIFTDKLNISEFKFNLLYKRFKPVMLSTTMTRLTLKANIKYYELELMKLAHEKDKAIVSLETVENEVAALEKIKLEDQVSALKQTIEDFDTQLEEYQALVKAYQAGDLHTTLEYSMHPVEIHDDYEKYFVFERNKQWIPKIENYMAEGSTFFAVGASHLSETEGLLNLLQDSGYTVKPLK